MRRLVLSVLVCGLLALPATAQTVQNGSFENGIPIPAQFVTLNGGDPASILNWTVVGPTGAIDYVDSTLWTASAGQRSLDLNGFPGPGGIEQQIPGTTPGQAYVVTFDMAGNPWVAMGNPPGPTTMTMDVSAIGAGTQTQSFTFDTTGHNFVSMGWETMQFAFTADASSMLLRFMSTTSNVGNPGYGPALDNVDLNVVPLPGAILLGMLGLGAVGVKLRRFA